MADTREQVAALNGAIRDRLVAAGYVDDRRAVVTSAGERLGVGDRVATRRNDRDLGVANRDTWTVTAVDPDGTLTVTRRRARRLAVPPGRATCASTSSSPTPPPSTAPRARPPTPATSLLGEHTSAAAAYVAMTRGREDNMAHLVAENLDEARQVWVETFGRDRADLGPAHAAHVRQAEDLDRYAPHRPLHVALSRPARRLGRPNKTYESPWTATSSAASSWPATAILTPTVARFQAHIEELRDLDLTAATHQVHALLHEPALRSLPPGSGRARARRLAPATEAEHKYERAAKPAPSSSTIRATAATGPSALRLPERS